jgi:hypothetical protein
MYTLQQVRILAGAANTDVRTAEKFVAGRKVWRQSRERLEAAAIQLGFPLPEVRQS